MAALSLCMGTLPVNLSSGKLAPVPGVSLGGSTGAQLFRHLDTGMQYVYKPGMKAKDGHAASEVLANVLYRAAGVRVPCVGLVIADGRGKVVGQLSEFRPDFVPLHKLSATVYKSVAAELQRDFLFDCLLANWDVVVEGNAGALVPADGGPAVAVRLDNGGALLYRAMGDPKPLPPEVGEVDNMRDTSVNVAAAQVFGSLSEAALQAQWKRMRTDGSLDALLAEAPADLRALLDARAADLDRRFLLPPPPVQAAVADKKQAFDAAANTERSVAHWVRRLVFGALKAGVSKLGSKVVLGGGIVIDHYLDGDTLNQWYAEGRFVRPILYCEQDDEATIGKRIRKLLNANTYGKNGRDRAPSVYMLAHVLRQQLGMPVDFAKVESWEVFAYSDEMSGFKHCIMLNVRDVLASGAATTHSNVAVLRLKGLEYKDTKMIGKSAAVLQHPVLKLRMMPVSHLVGDKENVSAPHRAFLMAALVGGHMCLHNYADAAAGADAWQPYHFAMRAAHQALIGASSDSKLSQYLTEEVRAPIRAYKQTDAAELVQQLVERATTVARDARDKDQWTTTLPGRYYSEKEVLKAHVTRAQRAILRYYTNDSSTVNIASLIAGLIPELRPTLTSQVIRTDHGTTIGQYLDDMNAMFRSIAGARKTPSKGHYRDMFTYRGVDLFELGSKHTVYDAPLPFAIDNSTLCSSSMSVDTAMNFLTGAPCCMLKIRIPSEYTGFLAIEDVSQFANETEVLFPSGSRFVVEARTYIRDATRRQTLVLTCRPEWPGQQGQAGGGGPAPALAVDLSPLTLHHKGGGSCGGGAERLVRALAMRKMGLPLPAADKAALLRLTKGNEIIRTQTRD